MVEHKQIIVFDPASNGAIEVDEGIALCSKPSGISELPPAIPAGEQAWCRVDRVSDD